MRRTEDNPALARVKAGMGSPIGIILTFARSLIVAAVRCPGPNFSHFRTRKLEGELKIIKYVEIITCHNYFGKKVKNCNGPES